VFNAIAESLEAVGVGPDRWLLARYDRDYVFESLHMLTRVWIGSGLHPESLRRMRELLVGAEVKSKGRRIALLRTEAERRTISNVTELIAPLRNRNFEFVDLTQLPFREQVHMFATADAVVGVLSSELAGLSFAPEGATILTLAPEGYLNSFFYSMMRERNQVLHDVRGAITTWNAESEEDSSFAIDPAHLTSGLQLLGLG
jgi:capsular polysaccharide biosynthesis protein